MRRRDSAGHVLFRGPVNWRSTYLDELSWRISPATCSIDPRCLWMRNVTHWRFRMEALTLCRWTG